jgi:site-specific recombinase XerC
MQSTTIKEITLKLPSKSSVMAYVFNTFLTTYAIEMQTGLVQSEIKRRLSSCHGYEQYVILRRAKSKEAVSGECHVMPSKSQEHKRIL